MAVLRRANAAPSGASVRAAIQAAYETRLAERPWRHRMYSHALAPLQAGEPVTLYGWQLMPHLRAEAERAFNANARYRLEADGRIVPDDHDGY